MVLHVYGAPVCAMPGSLKNGSLLFRSAVSFGIQAGVEMEKDQPFAKQRPGLSDPGLPFVYSAGFSGRLASFSLPFSLWPPWLSPLLPLPRRVRTRPARSTLQSPLQKHLGESAESSNRTLHSPLSRLTSVTTPRPWASPPGNPPGASSAASLDKLRFHISSSTSSGRNCPRS